MGERHGSALAGPEPDKRSRGEVRFRAVEVVHGDDVVAEAAGDPQAPDDATAGHGTGDGDGEVCRGDAGGDEGEGTATIFGVSLRPRATLAAPALSQCRRFTVRARPRPAGLCARQSSTVPVRMTTGAIVGARAPPDAICGTGWATSTHTHAGTRPGRSLSAPDAA
ncbi:MAG: hypothetical protein ACRDZS_00325 [Acidimicrobiales bacterium]